MYTDHPHPDPHLSATRIPARRPLAPLLQTTSRPKWGLFECAWLMVSQQTLAGVLLLRRPLCSGASAPAHRNDGIFRRLGVLMRSQVPKRFRIQNSFRGTSGLPVVNQLRAPDKAYIPSFEATPLAKRQQSVLPVAVLHVASSINLRSDFTSAGFVVHSHQQ